MHGPGACGGNTSSARAPGRPYEVREGVIQSSKVEVNVVEHCNLSCRSCSHASPVLRRAAVDPAELERDLTALARCYHVDWLRLLGGEPLLHPELGAVLEAGRRSGVADRICLVSNGTLLHRMAPELWDAVDAVEVSLYPGKEPSPERRKELLARARDHGVDLRLIRMHRFREAYSEVGTEDDALVDRIWRSCRIAHDWRCHAVAHGRVYRCSPSYLLPQLLDVEEHSLQIVDDAGFGARLLAFLESPEPLAACSHCLGTVGKRFRHEQVRRAEFRALQARPSEELVGRRQWRRPRLVPRSRRRLDA